MYEWAKFLHSFIHPHTYDAAVADVGVQVLPYIIYILWELRRKKAHTRERGSNFLLKTTLDCTLNFRAREREKGKKENTFTYRK